MLHLIDFKQMQLRQVIMLIQALDLIWKTIKKTLASILYVKKIFFSNNQIFLNAIVIFL